MNENHVNDSHGVKIIKPKTSIKRKLSNIKTLLQENVGLEKQMLKYQKMELKLLSKIADAEM